jgi:hypothetical protein
MITASTKNPAINTHKRPVCDEPEGEPFAQAFCVFFGVVSGAFYNFTNRDNMPDFAEGVRRVKKPRRYITFCHRREAR